MTNVLIVAFFVAVWVEIMGRAIGADRGHRMVGGLVMAYAVTYVFFP